MLTLKTTSRFRKGYRLAEKRGLDMTLLDDVIRTLLEGKTLDAKYRDHCLVGNYAGFRECHIQSDWLLLYIVDGEALVLTAVDTGTHSDLFG